MSRGSELSAFNVLPDYVNGRLQFRIRDAARADISPQQYELMFAFDEVCVVLRKLFTSEEEPATESSASQQDDATDKKDEGEDDKSAHISIARRICRWMCGRCGGAGANGHTPDSTELAKSVNSELNENLEQLYGIASAVYNTKVFRGEVGELALKAYKAELVARMGPAIKNAYLARLLRAVVAASFSIMTISVVTSVLCYEFGKPALKGMLVVNIADALQVRHLHVGPEGPLLLGAFLISVMWGVWISFFARHIEMDFASLAEINGGYLQPWSQLLAMGLFAFILFLMFFLHVFELTVGNLTTADIASSIYVCIFSGLAIGYMDKLLPGDVGRKLEAFMSGLKNK